MAGLCGAARGRCRQVRTTCEGWRSRCGLFRQRASDAHAHRCRSGYRVYYLLVGCVGGRACCLALSGRRVCADEQLRWNRSSQGQCLPGQARYSFLQRGQVLLAGIAKECWIRIGVLMPRYISNPCNRSRRDVCLQRLQLVGKPAAGFTEDLGISCADRLTGASALPGSLERCKKRDPRLCEYPGCTLEWGRAPPGAEPRPQVPEKKCRRKPRGRWRGNRDTMMRHAEEA